jgi:hypothetical protein
MLPLAIPAIAGIDNAVIPGPRTARNPESILTFFTRARLDFPIFPAPSNSTIHRFVDGHP